MLSTIHGCLGSSPCQLLYQSSFNFNYQKVSSVSCFLFYDDLHLFTMNAPIIKTSRCRPLNFDTLTFFPEANCNSSNFAKSHNLLIIKFNRRQFPQKFAFD
jgi:hypothetical protein